jgi:superfamily I DNA/RNA helicase
MTDKQDLEVSTFGYWSNRLLGYPSLIDRTRLVIEELGRRLPLNSDFLFDEVTYILGRFLPHKFQEYATAKRIGRGISPRVDRSLRERIVGEVINPYTEWKRREGKLDWNDLAVELALNPLEQFDVIIVDEAQDFSANQMRAVIAALAQDHSLTLVLDAAQRIYPHSFSWREVGLALTPNLIFTLERNYRNTRQIARFAQPLLTGIELTDDGSLPDFSACERDGPLPLVLKGRFRDQMSFAIDYINANIDLANESVAFLHPKGGGWFREVIRQLEGNGLPYVQITREAEWPAGNENIALCTLHSAKGLEFDHVIIIGLDEYLTPHGEDEGDALLENHRRLLAMGIGRARTSVVIGSKPGTASSLINFLEPGSYAEREL